MESLRWSLYRPVVRSIVNISSVANKILIDLGVEEPLA